MIEENKEKISPDSKFPGSSPGRFMPGEVVGKYYRQTAASPGNGMVLFMKPASNR